MPEPATKQDVNRIYDALKPITEAQTKTAVDIAIIKTKLGDMPPRPCTFHVELEKDVGAHLKEHSETRRTWRVPVVKALVDMAKMAILFMAAFFFGSRTK